MINKKYIIEVSNCDSGETLERTNQGFNVMELIGVLQLTIAELIQQVHGDFKPDVIKRTVIEDVNIVDKFTNFAKEQNIDPKVIKIINKQFWKLVK